LYIEATGPSYHSAGEPEEWTIEISIIEGDDIPDFIEEEIIEWARSEY
jgi:hypothetical protein